MRNMRMYMYHSQINNSFSQIVFASNADSLIDSIKVRYPDIDITKTTTMYPVSESEVDYISLHIIDGYLNAEPVCFFFYAYNIDDGKVIDFHV